MKLLCRSLGIRVLCCLTGLLLSTLPCPARAQAPRGPQGPQVVSPEVGSDRRVTFRLLAPKAETVRLSGGDIPGNNQGAEMTKNSEGVWETTLGPLEPGAYRYLFQVDGVPVVDPRSPSISESNSNVSSLVVVPGSELMDSRDVPHGAIARITYYSKSLSKFRRMHVYTPPGYETGHEKYPVFYLLHGAGDNDDAWTSVGRAGVILDNLIAAGKAKPMVVVMPAGHTRSFSFGAPRPAADADPARPPVDEFSEDFLNDIMPFVERNYRVLADREHRAIAGLSMGGMQTLNIMVARLDQFGYFGVFSSGVFGIAGGFGGAPAPAGPTWEERHAAKLDDAALKAGLKLVWMGTGKDDFLLNTSRATVEMLKKHGFNVIYQETAGGHTWLVWRDYLIEFAPQLFR